MESALTSALNRGGRLVDLAYAGLVHQLGITQRFFPQVGRLARLLPGAVRLRGLALGPPAVPRRRRRRLMLRTHLFEGLSPFSCTATPLHRLHAPLGVRVPAGFRPPGLDRFPRGRGRLPGLAPRPLCRRRGRPALEAPGGGLIWGPRLQSLQGLLPHALPRPGAHVGRRLGGGGLLLPACLRACPPAEGRAEQSCLLASCPSSCHIPLRRPQLLPLLARAGV